MRFIQAILMSGRRHKKLNLIIRFPSPIFIIFLKKAYWFSTCIQNKLAYKVSLILSYLFVLRVPPRNGCGGCSTSRLNIQKLNLCSRADISKTARINAWTDDDVSDKLNYWIHPSLTSKRSMHSFNRLHQ